MEDYLMHFGVGPENNPPGRGSGRYAAGSGVQGGRRRREREARRWDRSYAKRIRGKTESEIYEDESLRPSNRREQKILEREMRRNRPKDEFDKKDPKGRRILTDEEKERLIRSGNREAVAKYQNQLTNEQLKDAINRVNTIEQFNANDPAVKNAKNAYDKVNGAFKKAGDMANWVNNGINLWNNIAKLNNTFNPYIVMPNINGQYFRGDQNNSKDNSKAQNGGGNKK